MTNQIKQEDQQANTEELQKGNQNTYEETKQRKEDS